MIQKFIQIWLNSNVQVINVEKLQQYVDFCLKHSTIKQKYKTANHHILPQCKTLFPQYKKETWNIVTLTHENHYIAHTILLEAIDNPRMLYAWVRMNGVRNKFNLGAIKPEKIIGAETYAELMCKYKRYMSISQANRIVSNESIEKFKTTIRQVEENGKTKAVNRAQKSMKTMKSKLWGPEQLEYVEWQKQINTGRKLTATQIEKMKAGLNRVEENGKTVAQNGAQKSLKTRDAKIVDGLPYREYCSQKFKENNPMKNSDIVNKVKNKLNTPCYEINGNLYTPIQYRNYNKLINGRWFILKNVFNNMEKIVPQVYIEKKLNRKVLFLNRSNYWGINKSVANRLVKTGKQEYVGCYVEEINYNEYKDKIIVENFI